MNTRHHRWFIEIPLSRWWWNAVEEKKVIKKWCCFKIEFFLFIVIKNMAKMLFLLNVMTCNFHRDTLPSLQTPPFPRLLFIYIFYELSQELITGNIYPQKFPQNIRKHTREIARETISTSSRKTSCVNVSTKHRENKYERAHAFKIR